jgi:hypothetical protein
MSDEGTEEDHYLPPASTRKRPLLTLKEHIFGLKWMMPAIEIKALLSAPHLGERWCTKEDQEILWFVIGERHGEFL